MTITEQLELKVAELAATAEQIAGLTAERDEAQAEVARLKTDLAAAQVSNAEAAQKLATANADHEAAVKRAETSEASAKTLADDLAMAKQQLKNPAVADATAGKTKAVAEGGGESGVSLTYEQAHAEYMKIEDPLDRAEYRKAHSRELRLK